MNKGYLPHEHHYKLIRDKKPSMAWDGKEDFKTWQKRAKEKLYELLGIGEIEPYRVPMEYEIESDGIAEDLGGAREIDFRYMSEENVSIPCKLCIPKGSEGKKLPLMITIQGHSTGVHVGWRRPKFPGDQASIDAKWDRDYSALALEDGFAVLSIEQRGFGANGGHKTSGQPRCREIAKRAILLGRTLIGERVWDIQRCVDVLYDGFGDLVDLDKLMLMGNSGGGTATTYASIFEDRIKIAIPSCAVCPWEDSIAIMCHCECNYVPYIAKYFNMGEIVAMSAPRRMIVVDGSVDNGFLLEGSKRAFNIGMEGYKALGAEDNLVLVVGEGNHRFYAEPTYPHVHRMLDEMSE